MSFILNLTLREIRSSWRQLVFFFVCIGIGVGAIVALRSLVSNLNRAVTSEARSLLTADVEVSSTNPWTENELAAIEAAIKDFPYIEARDETIQTNTMGRPVEIEKPGLLMLELKGVEPSFPLVGEFRLADGKSFDISLLENNGAIVSPLLLERLNLKVGERVKIGTEDFTIRGTIDTEPGGSSGIRLGPRVFIERSAFEPAGLTETGSRNRRKILFRTTAEAEPLVKNLRAALKNAGSVATVRSYREAEQSLAENFERAENYLSLTGLVILVLGGIGVWNVTRIFVEQKRRSIAILKCIGGTGSKLTLAYLLQILTLGLLGSFLGVALAQIALSVAEYNYKASLPANMSYGLRPEAVGQGLLLGLFVSALFALLPLLRIRRIKPNLLLREDAHEPANRFSVINLVVGAIFIVGLLLLAVWQANSWRVGTYFLGGLAATAAVLFVAAFLLTSLLKRVGSVGSFALRQSIGSLSRPGNQTRVILLAVGLGVFVVLAVQSLSTNLLREFDFARNGQFPSLFMIDIQRAQVEPVREIVREATGENVDFIPAVRSRIVAVNDKTADFEQREVRQQSGQIGREYVLTYRPTLIGEEKIVAGEFWQPTPSGEPEISIEEGMRGLMGMDVGSRVTFDILGQRVTARVTSIRKLDLRNPRSTFLVVFRPGSLEDAPQTFLGPVMTGLDAAARAKLQRTLVDRFPNISIIDTTDVVQTVQRFVNNITLGVSFVGAFVILSGVLILIGSIALTKFQRVYENAILKTLGAKRALLATILLIEYAVLGLLAGLIGAGAALGLSYVIAHYVFKIAWQPNLGQMLVGLITTVLLVMIVGAVSSFDVLLRKPLATLRSQ